MSIIQPGVGYSVTNSSSGITLDIEQQGWTPPGDQLLLAAQFSPYFEFSPEYVNHYQVNVPELPIGESFVLKVGRGGNVWMPQGGDCALEKRAEVLTTDGTTLVVVPGVNVDSPWASDEGHVVLTSGGEVAYYVYAYKVSTAALSDFYIYVSTDSTLADACPVTLPTGITEPDDPYDAQVVMVASVAWSAVSLSFVTNQHVVGSITWPGPTPADPVEYVNQFQLAIKDVDIGGGEMVPALKIASGGHIYRPINSDCDDTEYTENLTGDPSGPSPVDVVTGTGSSRPWASSDGYVNISAGDFYVYAFKVENEDAGEFYIYVSKSSTLVDACPVSLPPGITPPAGVYSVQGVLIGSASYGDGWTITQKIVGSITWPQDIVVPDIEQFTVKVVPAGEGWGVQVAKGRVLARCGDFVTATQSSPSPSFDYVEFVEQCLKEFNVKNFAVYPTGSIIVGANAGSPWASADGYVDVATDHSYGVYLVMNQFDASGYTSGAPYLAVIADDDENEALEKSRPYGDNSCDSVKYYSAQALTEQFGDGPYSVYVDASGSGAAASYDFAAACSNYNCQRVKIATIQYGGEPAGWTVTQHLIGTLTIPSQFNHMGIKIGRGPTVGSYTTDWINNPFSAIAYSSQNTAWNGAWAGYDKSFTSATEEIAL
jgi:hypothetical protein